MKKIKNFYDFIKSPGIYEEENQEIPADLTKNSAPYSPTLIPSEKKESSEILNAYRYKEYGINPLEISEDFESISTGPYDWKDGSSGMPIDIYFKSESPLFKKPSDKSTYCTGFTFAVGFVTCLNRGLLNDFTDEDIIKMQKVWNQGDSKTYPKLCVDAIANTKYSNGKTLGEEVFIENVKEGDFCQIWRNTGYGHSVIVKEIIKTDGLPTAIKYYSSNTKINPKTKRSGPGENTEYFTNNGGKVLKNKTYFARVSPPSIDIEGISSTITNSAKEFASSLKD